MVLFLLLFSFWPSSHYLFFFVFLPTVLQLVAEFHVSILSVVCTIFCRLPTLFFLNIYFNLIFCFFSLLVSLTAICFAGRILLFTPFFSFCCVLGVLPKNDNLCANDDILCLSFSFHFL